MIAFPTVILYNKANLKICGKKGGKGESLTCGGNTPAIL